MAPPTRVGKNQSIDIRNIKPTLNPASHKKYVVTWFEILVQIFSGHFGNNQASIAQESDSQKLTFYDNVM